MENTDYDQLRAAAQPDAVLATLDDKADELAEAGHGHHGHGSSSVRTVEHKGRKIEIKTTYEITIDGEPFDAAVGVNNTGRVHYHGLPTRNYASAVDLIKDVIDVFDEDLGGTGADHECGPECEEHGHDHGHDHGHGGGH